MFAAAEAQAMQQLAAAKAAVPNSCNVIPMELAQPTNHISNSVNPISNLVNREERTSQASGYALPNTGGAQERLEPQVAVHPERVRPSHRQDSIIGGQNGSIFMFGE
jgi:hypothetical protein